MLPKTMQKIGHYIIFTTNKSIKSGPMVKKLLSPATVQLFRKVVIDNREGVLIDFLIGTAL